MFNKVRKRLSESLNMMFLNFNRWQGRKFSEMSMLTIDPQAYNFERHAHRQEFYMGKELEDHLIERAAVIKSIILHFEQGTCEDAHMLAVWVSALRATERKLSELRDSKQERFPKFSTEMAYLTKSIDRYEECLATLDKESPVYDTIWIEVKRLRGRWSELARTHNPSDLVL